MLFPTYQLESQTLRVNCALLITVISGVEGLFMAVIRQESCEDSE
ncbi:hypothetical protein EJP617_21590 [Erwinia sp. Ejp617]|nr:hypothetical protein EJP617_21590 [Erwinia sp. Ejp617]